MSDLLKLREIDICNAIIRSPSIAKMAARVVIDVFSGDDLAAMAGAQSIDDLVAETLPTREIAA